MLLQYTPERAICKSVYSIFQGRKMESLLGVGNITHSFLVGNVPDHV